MGVIATFICPKHQILKHKDTENKNRCLLCDQAAATRLAERRRFTNEIPTPCVKHNVPRYWDASGKARCRICKSEYDQTRDKEYHRWQGINSRCHNPTNLEYSNYGGRGIFVHPEWRRDPTLSRIDNLPAYNKYKQYVDDNIGSCPSKDHSLDRKHNRKGYEPGNIKWSDRTEQNNNKRVNINYRLQIPDDALVSYMGMEMTILEFANLVELYPSVAKWRYAFSPDPIWLLYSGTDRRDYKYKDHLYNQSELFLISGIPRKTLNKRLCSGWSVESAVETPVRKLTKINT